MAKQPPLKKNKRPSMQDVAELAGVSRTTVSFVVNKTPHATNIPQETKERVLEAVEALGYRPNALARGLRSNRTHTIGFITDEIATTPHAGKILEGAQELAWTNEYLLLLVNTGGNESLKKAAVDMMLERQVDGIIYATMYHRQVNPPANMREVPSVLLDCFVADRSLPSIVPDEVTGGQVATSVLLKKGHQRIGLLNNIDPIPATFGRLEGYKQALAKYDITYDETLVCYDISEQLGGYRATLQLMQAAQPPTALFCFNDRMAMGAYDALRQMQLRIPDNVAVVGFDNQELLAANLHPGLTTVALPHYEMGQWAVEHLLELIGQQLNGEQPAQPVQQLQVCPLVERESV